MQDSRGCARTTRAMSVSSEVRRTLVKSPPELWAELSDPATLARHLGELGEIRITGTDPERLVDWEATGADGAAVSGRVEIEPSGWGTRVTLSASRVVAEQESERASEPELAPAAEPAPEAIEIAPEVEPAPESESAAEAELELKAETEPEAAPERVEPEPRLGFFARLFRRRKPQPAPEATLEPTPEPEPEPVAAVEVEKPAPGPGPEPVGKPKPAPITVVEVEEPVIEEQPDNPASDNPAPDEPAPDDPAPDIAAELVELEEQTTAVLTGVLDRLGAAHHRPFSRA